MNSITPPEVRTQDSVTIIGLGEDYANLYGNLVEHLTIVSQLADSVSPPRLVIDMQHVRFMGSAFIGFIVSVSKKLKARESGRFALCGLSGFCQAAISASKLDSFFETYATVDDAVQKLSEDL